MILTALALAAGAAHLGQSADVLRIDPLLLTQAAQTWSVIARKDNPVWPGWNATDTPILIYLPGQQDVLINHPKPPEGFTPYTGPLKFQNAPILIKNGPTLERLDGQNTAREVNGVETLMLADTLSTRKQSLESLAEQARGSTGDLTDSIEGTLAPHPYDGMQMFAHEAFHVYQFRRAPNKGGSEALLMDYPSLSVDNNVGYAVEADELRAALLATDPKDVRAHAIRWLSARQSRRGLLKKSMADYEDGTEFNEGLAKYVEYRLLQALERQKPIHEMWLVQGFHGFADMTSERKKLLDHMVSMMSGLSNVNNDPYGASPVRMRLYYSGMAVGALLDKLGANWHDRIFDPKGTLTDLASEAIHATSADLKSAQDELARSPRLAELTASKRKLATDGQAHIEKVLADFESAPGQLVIDYSSLEKPRAGLSFTPFGILRIDENRTVFRLIPMQGIVNQMSFREDGPRPILQDRPKKQFTLLLTETVTQARLDQLVPGWRSGPVKVEELSLPGVSLKSVEALVKLDGKRLILTPQK